MAKKHKPTITVKPVTWNTDNGSVLKYQAVAELNGVRIYSDPAPTQDAAIVSLLQYCNAYTELAAAVAKYTTIGENNPDGKQELKPLNFI